MATPPGAGETPSMQTPVCFRHPSRQTWVSCVRCGRHACPECLRPAAVGQQCVECIRAGNSATRSPVTVFGGRQVTGATVTWALIAVNVLLYLIVFGYPNLVPDLEMIGVGLYPNGAHAGVAAGEWYRLITSAFITPSGGLGIVDIVFNMWALVVLGPALERQLGHLRYLGLYLVSALGGSVALLLISPGEPAAGASGAIFGLFGAWFVVSRRLHLDVRWIVSLLVLNFAIGFVGHNYIAWQAHVGGLIVGGLLAVAYAYAPRANRMLIQGGATVVLVAILVAVVVLRSSQLAPTF